MNNANTGIRVTASTRTPGGAEYQTRILLQNQIYNLINYRDGVLNPIETEIAYVEKQIEDLKSKNQGSEFSKTDFQTMILFKNKLINLRNEIAAVLNRFNPEIEDLKSQLDGLTQNSKAL